MDRCSQTPYVLGITIKDLSPMRELAFSQADLVGYTTGVSTTKVQDKIQAELEAVRQILREIEEDCLWSGENA